MIRRFGLFGGYAVLAGAVSLVGCHSSGGGGDQQPNLAPQAPQLTPAVLTTDEDVVLSAQAASTDPNGDALTFSKSADPAHGVLVVTAAGAVTYTPAPNYHGLDQFAVQVTDSRGATSSAAFTVIVNAVNDAPSFSTTALTYTEDVTAASGATASDAEGDDIVFTVDQQPAHATIIDIAAHGEVLLTPAADFFGTDSFVVTARDSAGASTTATVTLNITNVNDAPVAHDDQILIASGAQQFDVSANDVDVDGDGLSVSIVTQPALGTASVVGNQISYQPVSGYMGPMSIGYRVADPAGATSTAIAHLVIGRFQGLIYIEGNTQSDLVYYDGLTRNVPSRRSNYEIFNFVPAKDGRHVVYSQRASQSDNGSLYIADLSEPPPPVRLPIYGSPVTPAGGLKYSVNRDGSYVLVADRAFNPVLDQRERLIRTSDGASFLTVPIPIPNPNYFPSQAGVFNPVTDEYYFQTYVSGVVPQLPFSVGFSTLFAGSISNPPIAQIGATYPIGNGSGSGLGLRVTADGQHVVHVGVDYSAGFLSSLLVNDRVTHTEMDLYRPFAAGEFPVPFEFDMNKSGSSVCFRLNTMPLGSSTGPGRFWIASPAAPGSATAVTRVADSNFDCRWASDGKTFAYWSGVSGAQPEIWVVDTTNPTGESRAREPLATGESTAFLTLASENMTAVIGILTLGPNPTVYRVDLASPGSSVRIGSPGVDPSVANYTLDAYGDWLAYLKDDPNPSGNGTIRRLHMLSTRVPDFEMLVPSERAVVSFQLRQLP